MLHRLSGLSILALLGAAACGGTGPDLAPYTIDSRVDGVATVGIVAYEKDGAWVAAAEIEPGVFTFAPESEAFGYATICKSMLTGDSRPVNVAYTTYSDVPAERSIAVTCAEPTAASEYDIALAPAEAQVAIGFGIGMGPTAHVYATDGLHDLVAFTDTRVLIRRGVAFPLVEAITLDVTASGVDLVNLPLALETGEPGEALDARYTFATAGKTLVGFGGSARETEAVRVVPASAMIDNDFHNLAVFATRGSAMRSTTLHTRSLDADPKLALPPGLERLEAIWDDGVQVRWEGRPAGEQRLFAAQSGPEAFRGWSATMTAEYLEATGDAVDGSWTTPDLSAITGWKPSWTFTEADLLTTSVMVAGGTREDVADGYISRDYQQILRL